MEQPIDQERTPSRREAMVIGTLFATIGLYLVRVSLGLPPPSEATAPMWVVTLVGLGFLLGGFAVLIPAARHRRGQGRRRAVARGAAVVARAAAPVRADPVCRVRHGRQLRGVRTGARSFGISLPFFTSDGGNDIIGRAAFGIGAAITWLCLIAFAVLGWCKLVRGRKA